MAAVCDECGRAALFRCSACKHATYCSEACARAYWAEGGHAAICMPLVEAMPLGAHQLTAHKAREILHDGSVHGHALTERQRRFMGWVAGGRKHRQH